MSALAGEMVLAAFLVFCRIGACLLVMPGFSAGFVPQRVRLFIALLASLSLTPLLLDAVRAEIDGDSPAAILSLVLSEVATGFLIGFIGRLFFAALQFIASAITQSIGLSAMPGTVVDDDGQQPAIATLFTLTATTLFFVMNFHAEVIHGLVASYGAMPPGRGFVARLALAEVSDGITAAFLLALRIGSPFIVFSVIFNFAVGIINKLVPQIPVFFIATPFITAGGLFLLFYTVKDFMAGFMGALSVFLAVG